MILSDVMLPGAGRFPTGEKAAGEKDRDASPFSDGAGGASEGDMSLFASMNLQIAWLNSGTDAKLEWQWDGGHVPSEIFGDPWRSTSMRCMENTWKEQQRSRRQPRKNRQSTGTPKRPPARKPMSSATPPRTHAF